MFIPFSVRYKTKINKRIEAEDYPKTLKYIEDFMKKKTADEISIRGNKLTFKCDFFKFGWNANILSPLEKGIFNITNKGNETIITYEFFMYRFFGIICVLSITMGLVSHEFWFGIFCFAFLGGLNWVTALIRHQSMFTEITDEISEFFIRNKNHLPEKGHI
jgi:hypothetical protein